MCGTIRWVEERNELHVIRLRFWLRKIDKLRQRKSVPRNHHGPGFHTAMPVVPAFDSADEANQLIYVDLARVRAQSANLECPWRGFPTAVGLFLGLALASAPFVEVVVAGDQVFRRKFDSLKFVTGVKRVWKPGRRGARRHR